MQGSLGSPRHAWAAFFCTALLSGAMVAAQLYQGTQLTALVIAFTLALAAAAIGFLGARDNRPVLVSADLWVVALAVLFAATVLQSRVVYLSANAALWLGLFFCAYAAARVLSMRTDTARLCATAVGLVGIASGIAALSQYGGRYVDGPYLYRHMFSAVVVLSAFLVTGGVLSGTRARGIVARQIAVFGVAAIAFVIVGLNGSRGVMLASIVALVTTLVFLPRGSRLTLTGFAVGAAAGYFAANLLSQGFVVEQAASIASPASAGLPRFVHWASVWPLIWERPLLGHGPDLMFAVWQPYRDPQDLSAGYYVHNSFLDFAVTAGVVVAVTIALIFRSTIRAAISAARSVAPDWHQAILAAWVLAAIVGLVVHALVDFNLLVAAIWLGFGVCAGLVGGYSSTVRPAIASVARRWLPGAAALAGTALLAHAGLALNAHHTDAQAVALLERGEIELAYAAAQRMDHFWPRTDQGKLLRATLIASVVLESDSATENPVAEAAYRNAIADIDAALAINALRPETYRVGARLHLAAARLGFEPDGVSSALTLLRRALDVNPRSLETRLLTAHALQAAGQTDEALAVLIMGLRYRQERGTPMAAYREQARAFANALGDRQALALIDAHR